MIQKEGLCLCACVSNREKVKGNKSETERETDRAGERDLTFALLEMGFLWMGELGEGREHIKSHFQFVAGS